MKLYFAPGACSLAAHILVLESDLPCALERVDLATHKTAQGDDYRTLNPKGYVPALVLANGELLTEASVVLQYLSDQKPEAGLMSAPGTLPRYRQLEWLSFIATEIHKQFSPLFRPETHAKTRGAQRDALGRRFTYLCERLKDRPYLMGEAFTAPDAYLFTVLNWTGFVKIDLAPWPRLGDYLATIRARPSVERALRAEGLIA